MSTRVERALPDGEERVRADARMRALLAGPAPGPIAERLALLHFTGRRTGRLYTVPAGIHRLTATPENGLGASPVPPLVVATGSPWRHNFTGGAGGELTWRGRRTPARFTLVTDLERTARGYLMLYQRYGDAAGRRLGIAVTGEDAPGLAEFTEAVDRCGLALVEVGLAPDAGSGAAAGTPDAQDRVAALPPVGATDTDTADERTSQ
ncbi:hypothetical protein [Streptomyces albipurpureus]|uniref:Uncharacterized protein n=1 Tax=Streptomyces albipurpureus TaxID=2897419 RepID=A0ABT0UF56_9ACTN|nr:hypothetical protein [Streptomyces sp. CWNU-1]MCM2387232.1 hypothetical protein [Streptomyces sp. CWNU-1]